MPDITTNYGLKKPKENENADINILNANMDAIDEELNKRAKKPVTISGTLEKGKTSISLTNDTITTDSIVDIYASAYGVVPVDVKVSTGQVALTFDAQAADVSILVEVR